MGRGVERGEKESLGQVRQPRHSMKLLLALAGGSKFKFCGCPQETSPWALPESSNCTVGTPSGGQDL